MEKKTKGKTKTKIITGHRIFQTSCFIFNAY